MNILVFDIETIPDIENGRKLYNLQNLSQEEVYEAMLSLRKTKVGHDFQPHYLQQIVTISLVLFQNDTIKVWSLGEPNTKEAELIQRFFAGIEKYTPTLVSWNGGGFDLPTLHYRGLLHGISAQKYWELGDNDSKFKWNNYLNRFHYRHIDLMDILAAYQNKAFAPLDEIATMLGFPGKMGMHGSLVFQEYCQGNIQGIRNYCETDVLNTFCVYLRFELMRGLITYDNYQQLLFKLKNYLLTQIEREHLQEFANKLHI